MARMTLPGRDVPLKQFVMELKDEVQTDNLSAVAGSVTFATLLSLFPFLIFLVALAGILINPADIQHLVTQMQGVAPPDAVRLVEQYLTNLTQASGGGLLTFGAVGAIWAASRGVRAFIHALNVAYGFAEDRPGWKVALLATATVLVGAVILVLLVGAVVALPAVAQRFNLPLLQVASLLRLPVAGLLMLVVWAALDSVLPAKRRPFRPFTFGNLAGLVLWLLASWGFSLYVSNFGNYNATYGALGGVIVLLLWMNLSVLVFLLAAEMNGLLERVEEGTFERGSRLAHERTRYDRAPNGSHAPASAGASSAVPTRTRAPGSRERAAPEAHVGSGRPRSAAPAGRPHAAAVHETPRHREGASAKPRTWLRLAALGAAGALLKRQWSRMRAQP